MAQAADRAREANSLARDIQRYVALPHSSDESRFEASSPE